MKANEKIFTAKLSEMEQQYGNIQNRIRICQQKDPAGIQEELQKAWDEYQENLLTLEKEIKESRSPAVAELTQTQWEYGKKMEHLLESGQLEKYLHTDTNCPDEDQAEAAALYAEYAMDYAVQSLQYALISALSAINLQIHTEITKGESL